MGLETGLERVFTMMEPRLGTLLHRFGLPFRQIGGLVDYHGVRGPFQITRQDVLWNVRPALAPLLSDIRMHIRAALQCHFSERVCVQEDSQSTMHTPQPLVGELLGNKPS
jgi:hypothetical protein